MKKKIMLLSIILALVSLLSINIRTTVFAAGAESDYLANLIAESAILMDFTTGKILFEKNAHVVRPPASTTKIMTALVALERGDLKQEIVTTPKASQIGGSSLYLNLGEKRKLEDMLYGVLLSSGNDASVAIAENLAGSEEEFAAWMTEKAKLLGAKSTTFLNSSGMPKSGHLSTAHDLAKITRYALNNPLFDKMVRTKYHSFMPEGDDEQKINNHNKLLWRYQYADGVKTGYTREAGRCLVASATRNGHRLIAVVLNSKQMYEDMERLFEFGFNNFQLLNVVSTLEKLGEIPVVLGTKEQVPVLPNRQVTLLLPKGAEDNLKIKLALKTSLQAPVERLQRVGEVEVQLAGKTIDKIPVITAMNVPKKSFSLFEKLLNLVRLIIK